MCISIQCVHVTQGEPEMRLCPQPIFICDVCLCQSTIHECDKWAEMVMFILSFWASSWALKLFLKCIIFSIDIYWPLKLLTWVYFTIYICYIFNPHIKQSIIVLASPLTRIQTLQAQVGEDRKYKHFSNSFPVYRLYQHIQMFIQRPPPQIVP